MLQPRLQHQQDGGLRGRRRLVANRHDPVCSLRRIDYTRYGFCVVPVGGAENKDDDRYKGAWKKFIAVRPPLNFTRDPECVGQSVRACLLPEHSTRNLAC
jgi:hypothetical protein